MILPIPQTNRSRSDDGCPVDLAHLRRYTLGQAALEREVLGLFVQQLAHTIASMRMARTATDWRFASHALKGSGRAVGAWPLAQLAEQAEKLCPSRDFAACQDIVSQIDVAAQEACAFIEFQSVAAPVSASA